eukprot:2390222-Rhodomonas_salina.1
MHQFGGVGHQSGGEIAEVFVRLPGQTIRAPIAKESSERAVKCQLQISSSTNAPKSRSLYCAGSPALPFHLT